ncbi:hypothetical protein AAFF_G00029030 [Aldrovandia affinis]|uniref:Secreted protein n=1 Tax=Aldrovandia affinis TaxID=143900 RepID=A0AAD7WFY7_9TELE|nr:hypothetical protein AAFF_G00029030 [Aldrovandia affinis]
MLTLLQLSVALDCVCPPSSGDSCFHRHTGAVFPQTTEGTRSPRPPSKLQHRKWQSSSSPNSNAAVYLRAEKLPRRTGTNPDNGSLLSSGVPKNHQPALCKENTPAQV